MDAYPIFMKLRKRPCLVVGGGERARCKAELLLRAGADLTVSAPRLTLALAAWAETGRIRHHSGPISSELLQRQALIVVATGDEPLANHVSRAARRAGIPVNVVDRPELSTFISGALVDRSPVLVAISTGGTAPILARDVRFAVERLLPRALGRLARFAEHFRSAVKAAVPEERARRRFWERFFHSSAARAVLMGDELTAQSTMLSLINRGEATESTPGVVHIVGVGSGDPDLLTLRASRLLGEADVVVVDRLVAPAVLDHARRDAEHIFVGATAGGGGESRHDIGALLATLVRDGKRVVRLKDGEPFTFGSGDEELAHLRERGIPVEVVPGVFAAPDGLADAGIPFARRAFVRSRRCRDANLGPCRQRLG